MTYIKYIFLVPISFIGTLLAYVLNLWACLYLDADGNLVYLRGYLQTTDNPATGDPSFWHQTHAGFSRYRLALYWLSRNPAQGLDSLLEANVTMQTPITVHWHNGDNYFYTCTGYFHLSYRIGLATGGFGWRLNNIVEGYPHPTMGQIEFTPIRFHK